MVFHSSSRFSDILTGNKKIKFEFLLVGLEFKGPVNTVTVMLSWSVYLITLFLDRLSSLCG